MSGNSNLHKANREKNDEFYTQLSDIEAELKHYRHHFKGKTVFCNCDDPYESNFFKYFAMNFNFLGLKKLIATCYDGSPIVGGELSQLSLFNILPNEENIPKKFPYKIEITEVIDTNHDGSVDLTDVEYLIKNDKNVLSLLAGNGDFRSEECIEILKEADIIVTNPPFSLFREYIAQLIEYDKKFIIIGNKNAYSYKEIFPLLKENIMWIGYTQPSKFMTSEKILTNKVQGLCRWFTNLDISKRHEELELYKRYTTEEYPKYDNYNAINVEKVSEIPEDYYEMMGVPITFFDKFNPAQFEIMGITDRDCPLKIKNYTKQEASNYSDLNRRGTLFINGKLKSTFAKVIIRRKQNGH